MKIRATLAAVALAGTTLVGAATLESASAAPTMTPAGHACTRNSAHHCIKGGQFCPKAKYGHSGWDAHGRRWVCRGSHQHPHWMHPR